jgi:hypothetical protein
LNTDFDQEKSGRYIISSARNSKAVGTGNHRRVRFSVAYSRAKWGLAFCNRLPKMSDAYRTLLADDVFRRLIGHTMFPVIDFQTDFYQIMMEPPDTIKAAFFDANRGLFLFRRMPLGLKTRFPRPKKVTVKILGEL